MQSLKDWSESGNTVYLKEYGNVKVFRQEYKKVYRYYIMSFPKLVILDGIKSIDFKHVHSQHWNIERFHRAVKQTCNIERFQVRNHQAIKTHVFCAISAFVQLELLRAKQSINNWYQIKKDLFIDVIKRFISEGGAVPFVRTT